MRVDFSYVAHIKRRTFFWEAVHSNSEPSLPSMTLRACSNWWRCNLFLSPATHFVSPRDWPNSTWPRVVTGCFQDQTEGHGHNFTTLIMLVLFPVLGSSWLQDVHALVADVGLICRPAGVKRSWKRCTFDSCIQAARNVMAYAFVSLVSIL